MVRPDLQEKPRRLRGGRVDPRGGGGPPEAPRPWARGAAGPGAAQPQGPSGISPPPPPPPATQPGTGTPGYWKNHPAAWPAGGITVGGVTYTIVQAIDLLGRVGSDKSITMFSSLVPAKLNVALGNDGSCVNDAIAAADSWMAAHPPGSGVAAASPDWKIGEPLHIQLDNYNNGLLCAPHRL